LQNTEESSNQNAESSKKYKGFLSFVLKCSAVLRGKRRINFANFASPLRLCGEEKIKRVKGYPYE